MDVGTCSHYLITAGTEMAADTEAGQDTVEVAVMEVGLTIYKSYKF